MTITKLVISITLIIALGFVGLIVAEKTSPCHYIYNGFFSYLSPVNAKKCIDTKICTRYTAEEKCAKNRSCKWYPGGQMSDCSRVSGVAGMACHGDFYPPYCDAQIKNPYKDPR